MYIQRSCLETPVGGGKVIAPRRWHVPSVCVTSSSSAVSLYTLIRNSCSFWRRLTEEQKSTSVTARFVTWLRNSFSLFFSEGASGKVGSGPALQQELQQCNGLIPWPPNSALLCSDLNSSHQNCLVSFEPTSVGFLVRAGLKVHLNSGVNPTKWTLVWLTIMSCWDVNSGEFCFTVGKANRLSRRSDKWHNGFSVWKKKTD